MPSALAIVSKAVFEKQAPGAAVGTVVPLDRYLSTHKLLTGLSAGGDLFLVTVRPPDERLWLVAILSAPVLKEDGWYASPNATPIADVGGLKGELRFASGTGIQAKPGALGMSLQTPRVLTEEDAALLRGAAGTPAAKAIPAPSPGKAAPKAVKVTPSAPAHVPPVPPASHDGLLAAFESKDGARALLAALTSWRETRDPALASVIDAISSELSPPPITSDTLWSKTASAADPLDLGALLAGVPELPVSYLPTAAQLLSAFPDDPRIGLSVATWTIDPLTTSSSTYAFWTRSLAAMVRSQDVRAIPLLERRLAMKPETSQLWPKFTAALEKSLKALRAVEPKRSPAVPKKLVAGLSRISRTAAAPAISSAPATKSSGPPLVQAAAHLAAGQTASAIEAMLSAWRSNRVPALADLIDRASRLLPRGDAPLDAPAKKSLEPWLAALRDDSSGAMPQLLRAINVGGPAFAERRLAELGSLPDDPRVAYRLAEISTWMVISPVRTQYWKALLELLARLGDVRTCAPLRAQFQDFTGTYYNHHRQARRIVGDFALHPPATPAFRGEELGQLEALSVAVGKAEAADTSERELIKAIAEAPEDDAPRLVYADWLQQRGHARGQYLALVLKGTRSPAETQRLAELEAIAHLHGALDDLTDQWKRKVERGIYRTLNIGSWVGTLSWRALEGCALTGLVERVEFDHTVLREPTPEDFARAVKAMPRLKAIGGVKKELAEKLAAVDGFAWVEARKELVRRTS